ncbi:MAG: TPM domain-containing protein, partial [Burkholderiales bacterium]
HWQVRRAFPQKTLAAIEQKIKASEAAHGGEIRFAVEGALSGAPLYHGLSTRERAIDVFSSLRMWDTDHRNGVLIYLLLADRSVEIVADRGVHVKTGAAAWEKICREMEAHFREGRYEDGAIGGIRAVTHLLTHHFPANGARRNALPDKVVVL